MLYIQYGTYKHTLNEAAITISRTPIESDQNVIIGNQINWQISGMLLADANAADPVSDLTKKIGSLKSAYSLNGRNITLYEDDGTKTQHSITNSLTANGVRVGGLSFPKGVGSEYATTRTYTISVQADEIFNAAARLGNLFIESSETVSTTGTGGPRYVVRETRFGAPVRQLVSQATAVKVSQSGSMKTLNKPGVPTPLYSNYEVFPARNLSVTYSPKDRYYRVNYSFQFEAPHQI